MTTATRLATTSFFLRKTAKSPLLLPLLVSIGAWLLALAFELAPAFRTFEMKTLDSRFRSSPHPELADTNVVIVAIDQNSLDFFERQQVGWPWPREFYGLLLEYLAAGGARVVAFDIDFSSRSPDRLEVDGETSDAIFAEEIGAAGNVILPTFLYQREEHDQTGDSIIPELLIPPPPDASRMPLHDRASAPRRVFQETAARLCVANFESDRDDIARRATMRFRFTHGILPHFGLACFMDSRGLRQEKMDSVLAGIPLDDEEKFQISWYGRGGPTGAFRYYSIHALIHSARKMKLGVPPDLPPAVFANKHVIVGGSAQGLYDYKPTPFTSLEPYPGMDIHATILSNLLNGHFVSSAGPWVNSLIGAVLAACVVLIFLRIRRIEVAVALIGLIIVAYLFLAWAVFSEYRFWLPMAGPGATAVLAITLTAVVSYATEGRQKRKLRKAFDRYVSPHVVTEILEQADRIELGGRLVEGTVYFSDIKDFTSISEHYAPKDLVAILNDYFSLASEIVLKNEAMLDKYIGDAVMAIFGVPVQRPDHARIACLTALEAQRMLDEYYRDAEARGVPRIVTRIGLNSGRMVVGNIGHTRRLDYTVIGDTVNLASRLEGVNKVFGTRIIISESTYRQAADGVEVRELDLIKVKGKEQAIRIYELLGEAGTLSREVTERNEKFAEALLLYRRKDFAGGVERFREILRSFPQDGPSLAYVERCAELSGAELPDDWDGVYTMHSK